MLSMLRLYHLFTYKAKTIKSFSIRAYLNFISVKVFKVYANCRLLLIQVHISSIISNYLFIL